MTIPSPNIWHWPDVYALENAAQDVEGAIWAALREEVPWAGRDVLDVGCGDGYHLPFFDGAASVVGVEPYSPLVERARALGRDVRRGAAEALPLPSESVDIVHARTAYFFGKGCEPGLAEARRVLRRGGTIAIVDLDATTGPYGDWMRADIPHYSPRAAERFFARRGFIHRRIATTWRFPDRATCEAVLGIEFSPAVAARAVQHVVDHGLEVPVHYVLRTAPGTVTPGRSGRSSR